MASKPVELKFTALDKASAIIEKITGKIENLGEKMKKVENIDPSKNFKKSLDRIEAMGGKMQSMGQAMSLALTLPIIATGKELVSAGADYQLALRDLQGRIDNLKPGQMEILGRGAREMGIQMGVGATEAIGAMTEFAKAGASFDALNAGAAKTALNLAKAEGIGADQAANLLSNMMKVFNITDFNEIEKIGDVLGKASGISSISIVDLENSMRHASGTASVYGMKIEQVAGAIATLGNVGVKGEMGGTTLRSLMNSLGGDQTRQAKLVKAGAAKSDFFNLDGTMKGFDQIFESLNKLNLSAEQYTEIFGKEFGGSIRKGADNFRAFAGDLEKLQNDSKGYLSELAKLKLDTFWGSWDQMKAAFKDIGNAMAEDGTLDALKGFVEIVRDLFVWFQKLSPATKKFIFIFAGFMAVLGPIIAAVGFLTISFAGLMAVLPAGATAGGVLLAMTGWGAAIMAVVASLAVLIANWDKVKFATGMALDWCEDRWGDFTGFVARQVNKILKLYNLLPSFVRGEKAELFDESNGEQKRRREDADFVSSFTEPKDWGDTFDPSLMVEKRNQTTIDVNMSNIPIGTKVSKKQDFGQSKVNLNLGYSTKYAMPGG